MCIPDVTAAVCQARAVQSDAACEDLEVEAGGESLAPEEQALGMFWGCSIWFCLCSLMRALS